MTMEFSVGDIVLVKGYEFHGNARIIVICEYDDTVLDPYTVAGLWFDNPDPHSIIDLYGIAVHGFSPLGCLTMVKSDQDQKNEMDPVWRFFNTPMDSAGDKHWRKIQRKNARKKRQHDKKWATELINDKRDFLRTHGMNP